MIILKLFKYFLGYVEIVVSEGFIERFINLCHQSSIPIWQIRYGNGKLYCKTYARTFKLMPEAARKTAVKVRILSKKGFPFRARRYKKRKGLLIGIAAFLFFIYIMSAFIWTIDVKGNEKVDRKVVLTVMETLGLKRGARKSALDLNILRHEALMKMKEFSWLGISVKGSHVTIEVKEGDQKPTFVDEKDPCNIIAANDGQIVSIEPYKGKAVLKDGDTVTKGDLIVSGIDEDKNGLMMLEHARARVIARTTRKKEVIIDKKQVLTTYTGKKAEKNSLILFGIPIKFYFGSGNPGWVCDRIEKENNLNISGINLPATWITEEYREKTETEVVLTPKMIEQQLEEKIKEYEESELNGVHVMNRNIIKEDRGASYSFVLEYECEEEIGVKEKITVEEG